MRAGSRRLAGTAPWLAALVMVVSGCSSSSVASATPAPSSAVAAPSAADSAASAADSAAPTAGDTAGSSAGSLVPESPIAGIVVDVDSAGLSQVKGFTLRTNAGETIVFTMGTLENADEFPPGHLKEHQTAASPILVFFHQAGGQLVVYRIEDAG